MNPGIGGAQEASQTERAKGLYPALPTPSEGPTSGCVDLLKMPAETDHRPKPREVLERDQGHPVLGPFLKKMYSQSRRHDLDLIARAYRVAEYAHRNQKRKSGEPYLTHCLEVARILMDLNLDATTVAAGLLHDAIEDTGLTLDHVRDGFGDEMATLVDGVTKIRHIKGDDEADETEAPGGRPEVSLDLHERDDGSHGHEVEQAETFRKMLLSMVKDIRVILVKLGDRLHNMRTLQYIEDEEKRRRKAIESLDVYAPLAHRLGIGRIRWELEDLSLKHLEPEVYRGIQEKVNLKRAAREEYISLIERPLRKALREASIKAKIDGRPKNFLSIYGKMRDRKKEFEEIYDLFALRIIVNSVTECYHALGLVHTMYTPVMARFKDFIATPKSNLYQSLHTTVIGPGGQMVEVQIRTWDMHRVAETGIAAHWRYKEVRERETSLDRHMAWLRQVMDWQTDTTDPREFMEELKIDLFPHEIFVFTPKGDLIQLPENAVPIDFAFAVHTDLGLHCGGAKVDGAMVALSRPLNTGETVEVIASPHQKPSRSWLRFVKTSKARSRIKRWLKDEEHSDSVSLGQELLERELKKIDGRPKEEELQAAALGFGAPDVEHLHAQIGSGELSAIKVVRKLFPETKDGGARHGPVHRTKPIGGVTIQGMDNLMIQFARCCHPIPGDKVVGLITRGRGISVHRTDCPNASALLLDRDRVVEVDWDTARDEAFTAQILVKGLDRKNLLRDITTVIADTGTNVSSGELKTEGGLIWNRFVVDVHNVQQLQDLIRRVGQVNGVNEVTRLDEEG